MQFKSIVFAISLFSLPFIDAVFSQSVYSPFVTASNPSLYPEYFSAQMGLSNARFFEINSVEHNRLLQSTDEELWVEVPDENGDLLMLKLREVKITAPDFKLRTSDGKSHLVEVGRHFQGLVPELEGSIASVSVYSHQVVVMFSNPTGNRIVAPLEKNNGDFSALYVSYNDKDLMGTIPFECHMEALDQPEVEIGSEASRSNNTCRVIRVFMEASYKTYQDRNNSVSNVQTFFTNFFNQVAILYNNEQINIVISEIFVWTQPDGIPTSSSSAALTAFGQMRTNNFNGDLAHWVTTGNFGNGGIAWLDVLCAGFSSSSGYGRFAYSNISNNFQNVPTYSWTVMVFSHEMGHNVGSPHTHNCGWTGGAIDSCYAVEGNCYTGPVVARQGTIMSYCHLTNQGINLALGFGTQPGNQLRFRTFGNNASCLSIIPGMDPGGSVTSPVCAGDTIFLTSVANPNNQYIWTGPSGFVDSSANSFVPAATSSNMGLYTVRSISASCTAENILYVQVVSPPNHPTIATVNGNYQVPNYSTGSFQWYNQNGPIPGANSNVYTANSDGQYWVVVIIAPCNFVLNSDTINRNTAHNNSWVNSVQIYPNPAHEYIGLAFENAVVPTSVWLKDGLGRDVVRWDNGLFENPMKIPVITLPEGLYVLGVEYDGDIKMFKWLVQHP
jgi:hypothetical protein